MRHSACGFTLPHLQHGNGVPGNRLVMQCRKTVGFISFSGGNRTPSPGYRQEELPEVRDRQTGAIGNWQQLPKPNQHGRR